MLAPQGPVFFPNDQGLGYITSGPLSEPYEQYIGSGAISSADGTVALAQNGGVIDLSAKASLDALLAAFK
jgi:hypothetical protein